MQYKRLPGGFRRACIISGLAAFLYAPLALAADLSELLASAGTLNEQGKASQQRINKIADDTQSLNNKYKAILKEIEGLKIYNDQQRRQIVAQERTMDELLISMNQVTVIQRQITPLMIRMTDSLEQFVNLDVPFQMKERKDRIAAIREVIDRADVVVSEKFGAMLNAFQIESEYGRTIEAYADALPNTNKIVDFLRVGRVALVYQTTDGSESGFWNKNKKQFEVLDDEYYSQIRNGIRIARKQLAVDIVVMPILAPETL